MLWVEYMALIERYWRVLVVGILGGLFLGWMAFEMQPERYAGEVVLSITRTAVAPTAAYAYDHFYRFQADEKLAETLSQYLGSAAGRERIAERSHLSTAEAKMFVGGAPKVVRLGTNLVVMRYATVQRAAAGALGDAIPVVANEYVTKLNEDARETAWFTVVAETPTITSKQFSLTVWLLVGGIMGFLVCLTLGGGYLARQAYQTWKQESRQ